MSDEGEKRVDVVGLSKSYRIGSRSTTLREAVVQGLKSARRPARTEQFWSLADVSFTVAEGESLGIVGRNGAGKSTILKILTGITAPTAGRVRTRGRIAALLEVGTGFHPELTGRENVYLNGAVLGMTRRDIKHRFDDIVDFSGVERFLDTPVKRYSSGMYLRLAFSVAAHLEPDVLIVDEILAVGDAEFQRKCLGRMADASLQGRTLVFVSHDLDTLSRLCTRALWLDSGKVRQLGGAREVVKAYLSDGSRASSGETGPLVHNTSASVTGAWVSTADGPTEHLRRDEPVRVHFEFTLHRAVVGLDVAVIVTSTMGARILDELLSDRSTPTLRPAGVYRCSMEIPPVLTTGDYTAGIWLGSAYEDVLDAAAVLAFSVIGSDKSRTQRLVALNLPISLEPVVDR
jgi:ABC-type polysaccharide/polyol phosphate transport system ATPase subunit